MTGLRDSIQLSMLRTLLSCGLISKEEYNAIKKDLMNDYGVRSDLTA